VGVLILTLLVVAHEFGHYIMARRNGVVVEEFAIGLPPKAWSKTLKNGVELSLNWLPIGGFCKMQGENDAANKKGDYGKATYWQKTKILFGGVIMNWLVAIVIFTILAAVGMPHLIKNQFTVPADTHVSGDSAVQIAEVIDGSPAKIAGLKEGDKIVRMNGVEITEAIEVSEIARDNAGREVVVEYTRKHCDKMPWMERTANVTMLEQGNDQGYYFGVSSSQTGLVLYRSTWSAPIVGVATTFQLTAETFRGVGVMLGDLVSGVARQLSTNEATREAGRAAVGKAGEGVAGPVGIVGVLFPQATESGPRTLLMLAGIISLSLAVMNCLPIPALDGGRWFLTTIYKLRRKKLTPETEEKAVSIGFMVLFGLLILITIVDVSRLF
jgi:regulator of sigma E protease